MSQILASNPQILQAALGQNTPVPNSQNQSVLTNSLSQNPIINALAAQLLLPQNHAIQQQQQQQQQMLNILQLIQNPNLLTYQNFLQQQNGNSSQQNDTNQQQQTNVLPAPTAQNPLQNQLNLLNQLITSGNSSNNSASGLQQSNNF